jgi:hypothetical protein
MDFGFGSAMGRAVRSNESAAKMAPPKAKKSEAVSEAMVWVFMMLA